MESFEDLELPPELVEALAAEGIEVPTALQSQAVPVLRRGNSAVLRAAPGSGLLVACGVPLLERLEPGEDQPGAIILTTNRDRADALASSLARLADSSAHRVAALGGPWALPELADILVCTPADLEAAVGSARVKLDGVGSLVVDGASILIEGDDPFAGILPNLKGDLQIVLVSESITPAVRRFVEQRARRAVFLPSEATGPETEGPEVRRGSLRVRETTGNEEDEVASLVHGLLEDHDHALLFLRSADRAADIGDFLARRGFAAGAPGDADVPVWLGVEALETREAAGKHPTTVAVSIDVPTDPDELDRRHGRWETEGVALVRPREAPHLRRIAREAGYDLRPFPPTPAPMEDEASAFRERVRGALEEEDLVPHLLLLEALFERHNPTEVAAALALLLRRADRESRRTESPEPGTPSSPEAGRFAWVRLFVSVGEKDGIGPGDLLGAIVGETGIPAERVGRIDLRNTFSRVEVDASVADRVIRALNGTSIRGRSMRVDYDRGETKGRPPGRGKAPRGRSGPGR